MRKPSRWRVVAGVLLVVPGLVGLVVASYAPVLDNGFVNYDDRLYILDVPQVRAGLTASSVRWAFETFQGANWFPLTRLSWMADAHWFGHDPAAFHRTSAIGHALDALLLWVALLRLSGAVWRSAFVAAVFAVHPLHVESVAWASARKDVVSGLFWMIALIAYAQFARRRPEPGGTGGRLALAAVATTLALGLMAKPTVVVLPFVLLLLDFWPLQRLGEPTGVLPFDTGRFRAALIEKWPLFALAIAGCVVTVIAQGSEGAVQSLEKIALSSRLDNAVVSYLAYVGKAFWPVGLAVYYPHPLDGLGASEVALSGGVLVAATLVAWVCLRAAPAVGVGWLWFLGVLVPVIGVVQVGQAAMADRYMYLSLSGLAIAVSFGAGAIASRVRFLAPVFAVAALAAVVAMVALTRRQVELWHSSTTLFEHALEVTERNHVAHINLGVVYTNDREWVAAERQMLAAIRIAPRSAIAHGVLGDALRGQERSAEALRQYRIALELEPGSARWLSGVGSALLDLERPDEAVEVYRRAVDAQPSATNRGNLALALFSAGRVDEAVELYERALSARPGLSEVRGNLGVALIAQGEDERGIAELERAVAEAPDLAAHRVHLGVALARRDGPAAGLEQLDAAIALAPERETYRELAARLAERSGQPQLAMDHYRAALELGERSVDTLNNLAWLLVENGPAESIPEAVALAEEAVESSGDDPGAEVLDTLAAVYAAAGRWSDAVAAGRRAESAAAEAGNEGLAAAIRGRLDAYRLRRLP